MKQRTEMQQNLTDYYDEDFVQLSIKWHEHDGMTWPQIARKVRDETGYRLSQATFASWAAYERSRR